MKCEWLWQDVQKSEFLIKFIQVTHGNSCEYTRLHLELVDFENYKIQLEGLNDEFWELEWKYFLELFWDQGTFWNWFLSIGGQLFSKLKKKQ